MASPCDSGARRQRRGNPYEEREPSAAAEEQDLISSLQLDLRLEILRLLPLKSAIRAGALSTKWRELWARRWPEPSSIRCRVSRGGAAEKLLESFGNRGVRALNRFSLTFRWRHLSPADFQRCVDYAAACAVEDLHLHLVDTPHADIVAIKLLGSNFVTFSFPQASPLLARISILGVTIDLPQEAAACSFSALEIIYLHWVLLRHGSVRELVAACPRLHTLDLRDCSSLPLREPMVLDVRPGARLGSLTVTRCEVADLLADTASGLCSFRYCGKLIDSSNISASAPLHDLCICFEGATMSSMHSLLGLSNPWLDALTNFSNLTVLTICSSTLPRPESITYPEEVLRLRGLVSVAGGDLSRSVVNLHFESLRELQLVMFDMDEYYLACIYEFFRTCYCPQLERLFVQFPCGEPFSFKLKKPFKNEKVEEDMMSEELSEDDASKEELSGVVITGMAPVDDPSAGKVSEEASVEELLEAEAPEDDKLRGATVSEEASMDKLPEAKVSEEASVEKLLEAEAREDDKLSGASVLEEEASVNELSVAKVAEAPEDDDISEEEALLEDNWLEEEGSEGDQSEEELLNNGIESLVLENDLKNLVLIKMVNFHGNQNEMKLVSSMLRKATRLNKLLLVAAKRPSPNETLLVAPKRHEHEEIQKIPLDELNSLETEVLLLEKASESVHIILRDSDDPETQSVHSKVITE